MSGNGGWALVGFSFLSEDQRHDLATLLRTVLGANVYTIPRGHIYRVLQAVQESTGVVVGLHPPQDPALPLRLPLVLFDAKAAEIHVDDCRALVADTAGNLWTGALLREEPDSEGVRATYLIAVPGRHERLT